MSNTNDEIEAPIALNEAIKAYFDGLYLCDTKILARVFHPSSNLFDADNDRIVVDPIRDYLDTISRRTPPDSVGAPNEDEIVWIDMLSPKAALAKVKVRIHNNRFLDHLMFNFDGKSWRIVAKNWHLIEVVE